MSCGRRGGALAAKRRSTELREPPLGACQFNRRKTEDQNDQGDIQNVGGN